MNMNKVYKEALRETLARVAAGDDVFLCHRVAIAARTLGVCQMAAKDDLCRRLKPAGCRPDSAWAGPYTEGGILRRLRALRALASGHLSRIEASRREIAAAYGAL